MKSDLIKRYSCQSEHRGIKKNRTKEERPAGASAGYSPQNETKGFIFSKRAQTFRSDILQAAFPGTFGGVDAGKADACLNKPRASTVAVQSQWPLVAQTG